MQNHYWIIEYIGTSGVWEVWAACMSRQEAREHAAELSFKTRIRKFIAA